MHATDRYRFGLASYYEVLEAQQLLFPAQQHARADPARPAHRVRRALRALGGGWSLNDAQWSGQKEAASHEREHWPWMDDSIAH